MKVDPVYKQDIETNDQVTSKDISSRMTIYQFPVSWDGKQRIRTC